MKKRRFQRQGYIYAVQPEQLGPIKFGFANSVLERLVSLQTGSPVPLVLLGYIRGTPATERTLHRRLASYRMHGEWFAASHEVLEVVADMILAGESSDIVHIPADVFYGNRRKRKGKETLIAQWRCRRCGKTNFSTHNPGTKFPEPFCRRCNLKNSFEVIATNGRLATVRRDYVAELL